MNTIRDYNSFFPCLNHVECYKLGNYGHKETKCRYGEMRPPSQNHQTKEVTRPFNENKLKKGEEYGFALYVGSFVMDEPIYAKSNGKPMNLPQNFICDNHGY